MKSKYYDQKYNLVNDVCYDDQERVAKVEQQPFLDRLYGVGATKIKG